MDRRDEYRQNHLASLLASTVPPPPQRSDHVTENYTQGGVYLSYPPSNSHVGSIYTRPHRNTSFQVASTQAPRFVQMHPAQMHPAQARYYQAPGPIYYQGHPYATAPVSQYDVRPPVSSSQEALTGPESRSRPFSNTQASDTASPTPRSLPINKINSPEIDSPTRRVIEELEEEDEADQAPVSRPRRERRFRKLTPVLVFDNDSDDGDYEENRRGKKRKKVHYDSEGAIVAETAGEDQGADNTESARSSTEEVDEPLEKDEVEEPEEVEKTQPKRSSPSKNRRKRARKSSLARKHKTTDAKAADAKARAEKASSLLKRKGKGRPIPKTVEECDEADLMMWQWKHNGRNWKDIREEWVRIMGVKPGRSSLSVRLAKMEDNFIDNGAATDLMILRYKEEVEAELEDLKWQKVAQKIKEERDVDLKPAVVRKRFHELKENGWVVGTEAGKQEGDQDENMEEAGDLESVDGQHDVEDDVE